MTGLVFVLLISLSVALGQVISDSCGDTKVIQNLNPSKYLGVWYEQARYFAIFEVNTRCSSANYSANADGTLKVVNTALDSGSGDVRQVVGSARPLNGTEGLLEVSFDQPIVGTVKAEYHILGTDYDNWASVYSCRSIGLGLYGRFAWLLIRDRNASEKVIQTALKVFTDQGIVSDHFHKVNQTGCEGV